MHDLAQMRGGNPNDTTNGEDTGVVECTWKFGRQADGNGGVIGQKDRGRVPRENSRTGRRSHSTPKVDNQNVHATTRTSSRLL